MQISKQELRQIIKEETELVLSEWEWSDLLGGAKKIFSKGLTAAPEAAIGWITRQIVSMMPGIEADGWIAVSIGQSVGNIGWDEWKVIIADTGGQRCNVLAQNIGEGLLETIAKKLLMYIEKAISDMVHGEESEGGLGLGDLMLAIGAPEIFAAQTAGKFAYTGALGLTYEMIANEVKDAPFFQELIQKLSSSICSTIKDIQENPSKIFGG